MKAHKLILRIKHILLKYITYVNSESIIFSAVKQKKILNGLLTLYNRTYNETKTFIKNVFDIARRKKKTSSFLS